MEPVIVIVWICVVVFAANSVLALVYLAGFAPRLRAEYGKYLFKILIIEIVVSSVAVFGYFINDKVHAKPYL